MNSVLALPVAAAPSAAPTARSLPLARERFAPASELAARADARRLLECLLHQDGSTTRLCETLSPGPVSLVLHQQVETLDVPEAVASELPGRRFLQRCSSLVSAQQVLTDHISWVSMLALPPALRSQLVGGQVPIGHLLQKLWVRRRPLVATPALLNPLWAAVGLPDDGAARAYVITAPEGPCMVVVECFRRALRAEAWAG